ncbi:MULTISPECIES: Zn-ribbon domain-containing OB-fold protein [unclassified Pseudofrankia]|uniref:Zn-ribbon domain-containing OB-fold protein n=1 Tax=unclassified Pseudofrankia TaxID=2994372 RepID=UPI000A5EE1E1|nr:MULTISPECIES: OB-fold domain-containing protein [unclassified Pseudofrankia]MDT3445774.1 OB-fold domain-containing protein [Pseudofrankia sp. BMG5.37]
MPLVDDGSRDFWRGGADGRLLIRACAACHRLFHPPGPVCPHCYSRSVTSRAVSGRATVASYTVTHRGWVPGYEPPYVVARVVLAEQPDLHLLTNVVGCDPEAVHTGMEVEVIFEQRTDVFVPLFQPVA